MIYRLFLEGDGTTGAMGVKASPPISTSAVSSPATADVGDWRKSMPS
jgi:hypothetical protein